MQNEILNIIIIIVLVYYYYFDIVGTKIYCMVISCLVDILERTNEIQKKQKVSGQGEREKEV